LFEGEIKQGKFWGGKKNATIQKLQKQTKGHRVTQSRGQHKGKQTKRKEIKRGGGARGGAPEKTPLIGTPRASKEPKTYPNRKKKGQRQGLKGKRGHGVK